MGSTGAASPMATASPAVGLTQDGLRNGITNSGIYEYAYQTAVLNSLKNYLDTAKEGDVISGREANSYHRITEEFTKLKDGWQYVRRNEDDGQVYENRQVNSAYVADAILSVENTESRIDWRVN